MLKHHNHTDGTDSKFLGQRDAAGRAAESAALRIAWSIPDAVIASGLSRSFLYRAMTRGQLAFVKKGRRRLIPAAALSNYVLRSDSPAAARRSGEDDGR